jgi:acetyltransferase-like isoleucine patch superfamily enzyme
MAGRRWREVVKSNHDSRPRNQTRTGERLKFLRKFARKILNLIREDPVQSAIKNGMKVGKGCLFQGGCAFGSEPYLITIGDYVELSANVSLITHEGAHWVIRRREEFKDVKRYGRITIGDNSFIGWGSIILPGVTIGSDVIVAAGSLVNRDIPPRSVWGGTPAKMLSTLEEFSAKMVANSTPVDEELYKVDKKAALLRALPPPW